MTGTEKADAIEVTREGFPLDAGKPGGVPGITPGLVIAGKYKIQKLLGEGGMGAVYAAEHMTLAMGVAVKVMHPHVALDPEIARRFGREARAVSMIGHPNVVRIVDFGVDNGFAYIAMELLHGQSLDSWLVDHPTVPSLEDVARVLDPVLAALEAAHRLGIIHRDLKPDNVFLDTGDDGAVVIKVVDFGLAHVDDARDKEPTLTKTDMVAGTPSYMSPEQCRSLVVTTSSDLYAVGCILTTLLQRRPPFEGESSVDLMTKHMFVPPPGLSRPEGAEPVPIALEKLRIDLLAKDLDRRPKTAAEVRRRLAEALDPGSLEVRLSTRSNEGETTREHRLPGWTGAESAPESSAARDRKVSILRLSDKDTGVTSQVEMALAVQSIASLRVPPKEPLPRIDTPVIVLDVGDDFAAAKTWIDRLVSAAPLAKVIVCADHLSTERLNVLIAAGAADVAGYPVAGDALGKKIDRVLRSRRRR